MAPEKQVFDPDGDLTFIFPSSPCSSSPIPTATTNELYHARRKSSLAHQLPAKEEDIHMLVSSKHMMLASPVFKAMLNPSFQEGEALHKNGRVDIPLPDDDPVVFTIILDIIHGRGRRVPKVLPLKMLALVSATVDKYQLQEPVAIFADSWIRQSADKMTAEEPQNLMMWLGVSWVFQNAEKFDEVTKLMIRTSKRRDLPVNLRPGEGIQDSLIPQKVLEDIQSHRLYAIESVYAELSDYMTSFEKFDVPPFCRMVSERGELYGRDCDCMLFGTLTKATLESGLFPAPQSPYDGVSVDGLIAIIGSLRARSLCDYTVYDAKSSPGVSGVSEGHNFTGIMGLRIKGIGERIEGLSLKTLQN